MHLGLSKAVMLHPSDKDDHPPPKYTYHLNSLASTSKLFKHVLAVVDSFTKLVWLYPTKPTDTTEVIYRLQSPRADFGNPSRIISDKCPAFMSSAWKDYYAKQKIAHVTSTPCILRANS